MGFTSEGMVISSTPCVLNSHRSPGRHYGLCQRRLTCSDPTSPVSGRLVGSCLLRAGSQTDGPVPSLALSHPRYCDKHEVQSCPLADCEVLRHDHPYRGRLGFPSLARVGRFLSVAERFLYYDLSPGSALAGGPGSPGIAQAPGPSLSPSDTLSAVASPGALVFRDGISPSSGALDS